MHRIHIVTFVYIYDTLSDLWWLHACRRAAHWPREPPRRHATAWSCSTGPTPLHLAARCGSLDSVACLVSNYANVLATDQDGWAPIHNAAYYDHEQVIKLLIRKNEAMLELQTKDE